MAVNPGKPTTPKDQLKHNNAEPGAILFRSLKRRLVFWYGSVLSISLLIIGISLYFIMQNLLFEPPRDQLRREAERLRDQWTRNAGFSCPLDTTEPTGRPAQPQPPPPQGQGNPPGGNNPNNPPRREDPVTFYIACMDSTGKVLESGLSQISTDSKVNLVPLVFLTNPPVKTTLLNRSVSDIAENNIDQVFRYALTVRNVQNPNGPPNILMVGRSVVELQRALLTLRNVLIGIGLLSLLGTSLGGFFLAERALVPTRLAFKRQQGFIADASHELGTPLTLLRSNAELLLRRRHLLAADDAELLDDIVNETEFMTNITDRMLSLARLDSGRMPLEYEVVNLAETTARVARRVKNLAASKNIIVETGLDEEVIALADEQLIEQSILILTDNALKYTPAGGKVRLSCRNQRETNQVRITISDTGLGIPPDKIPHLGERFFRVDKVRARSTGGAGLGLSLAFGIISQHNGTLNFHSEPGKGTQATILLAGLVVPKPA